MSDNAKILAEKVMGWCHMPDCESGEWYKNGDVCTYQWVKSFDPENNDSDLAKVKEAFINKFNPKSFEVLWLNNTLSVEIEGYANCNLLECVDTICDYTIEAERKAMVECMVKAVTA